MKHIGHSDDWVLLRLEDTISVDIHSPDATRTIRTKHVRVQTDSRLLRAYPATPTGEVRVWQNLLSEPVDGLRAVKAALQQK